MSGAETTESNRCPALIGPAPAPWRSGGPLGVTSPRGRRRPPRLSSGEVGELVLNELHHLNNAHTLFIRLDLF